MGYYANSLDMEIKVPKENLVTLAEKIKEENGCEETDVKTIIKEYYEDFEIGFEFNKDGTFELQYSGGKSFEKPFEILSQIAYGSATFCGEDNEMWGYKFELGKDMETLEVKVVIDDKIDYKALAEKQAEYIKALKADYDLTYKMYSVNNTFANGMSDDDIVEDETGFETYEELDEMSAKVQAKRQVVEKELEEMEQENGE